MVIESITKMLKLFGNLQVKVEFQNEQGVLQLEY